MIRAVVFDVFGTLIKTSRDDADPYARLLKAIPAEQRPERRSLLTRDISLEGLAKEWDVEFLLPLLQRDLQSQIGGFQLFDDVRSTIFYLQARGLKVAACSNLPTAYGDSVRSMLPGLRAYIFSFEVAAAKPSIQIYHALFAALNCNPREIAFIGDGHRADVEGPAVLGMHSRRVDRQKESLMMTAKAAIGRASTLASLRLALKLQWSRNVYAHFAHKLLTSLADRDAPDRNKWRAHRGDLCAWQEASSCNDRKLEPVS